MYRSTANHRLPREENRVLGEQLGGRRVRFKDDLRRRLAAKAKGLGRKILVDIATIVTPETLLAWHRKLIANGRVREHCEPKQLIQTDSIFRTLRQHSVRQKFPQQHDP